jgi:phospholipase/carboxylesterase
MTYAHTLLQGAPGASVAFLFHGTGGDERQMIRFGRKLLPDATLVAPRGDVNEGGALRFFRRKAEGLYDMADLARATGKMADFIEDHVARSGDARIIGIGYSNGANILASLIFARRELFHDAVLLHPLIGWEPEPGQVATRVLITAGERDPICPPALTKQLESWFRNQGGARVETQWHTGGHGIEPAEILAAQQFLTPADMARSAGPH